MTWSEQQADRPPSIEEDRDVSNYIRERINACPPGWAYDPDTDEPLDPSDF